MELFRDKTVNLTQPILNTTIPDKIIEVKNIDRNEESKLNKNRFDNDCALIPLKDFYPRTQRNLGTANNSVIGKTLLP